MNNREDIERVLKNILVQQKDIELAYIFGSFIKEKISHDIDIAVLIKNSKILPADEFHLRARIGRILERSIGYKKEVDVKILNHSPLSFQFEVIHTGILIMVRNEIVRIRYECQLLSQYLDFQEVERFHNKAILTRL